MIGPDNTYGISKKTRFVSLPGSIILKTFVKLSCLQLAFQENRLIDFELCCTEIYRPDYDFDHGDTPISFQGIRGWKHHPDTS